ncbi:hypothetical protein GCM10007036_40570 [Alsobacter metallidurans]|uniref:Murein endopeptidase K n=1 Tax=Alsobacter metallidurans TaxID=340221 RepID=A0A917MLI3_9HYPH|nr:DUF882 domain-containing protein [Alsobacter metallidurans]GGH30147.1 hypothetical protein GCM10007036_40570 [Alsobacter metallidurans]
MILGATGDVGNAVADGGTRSLSIYHTHSKESATITFKRNGVFDRDGLEKLNWMLRDWRRDEPTSMDPRLFDIVWEVYREVGSEEPINVVSAYRAPETNAMLRRRSRAVAKHSQHMLGKAMDFYLPDASMAKVREIGLRLQRGGVGYYPTAYNPFVHLDAGSVRHWPRLSRDQLTRLFPDGKTVHLPLDNKPMARYEEAAAEVIANGGTVFGGGGEGEEGGTRVVASRKGKSFFAALFGLGGEDEDEEFAQPARGRGRGQARPPAQVAAYAPTPGEDDRYVAVNASRSLFGSSDPAPVRSQPFARRQPAPEPAPAPVQAPVQVASLGPAGMAVMEPSPPPEPAPAPVLPRRVDVPLPTARPASIVPPAAAPQAAEPQSTQPQLVWQAGPAGAPSAVEARVVNVPLPMARPADLGAGAPAAPVYANVPLPPSRPVTVASLFPMVPASMPIAPVSGALPAGMPSLRPTEAPHAAATTTVASRQPEPAHDPDATASLDRDGLQSLFAGASLAGQVQLRTAVVNTAKAKPSARDVPGGGSKPASTVAMRFEQAPAELRTDRFSGPAVKALPTASFSPAR